MSFRKRLFLSYATLIVMVFIYLSLFSYIRYLRTETDAYMTKIYKVKNTWNDLLISMNDMVINWADGRTYRVFRGKSESFATQVESIAYQGNFGLFYPEQLNASCNSLGKVWALARETIDRLNRGIESPDFNRAVRYIMIKPGLQRLNHLWLELFYEKSNTQKRNAYAIREVIDAIEFFPIYSETMNKLFDLILSETVRVNKRVIVTERWVSILFFSLFIIAYLLSSFLYTRSISQPIINLSLKLTSFMGETLEKTNYTHTDELELLSSSVNRLIAHYTYLSELAERLSFGDIDSPINTLSEQGVVGNALKKIALYLRELAKASEWIKQGNYGAEIRVKSEKDILAKSFNIMSGVIKEKITTLSNIFEAVEEGILVIDEDFQVAKTNSRLLSIMGADQAESAPQRTDIPVGNYLVEVVSKVLGGESVENYYTEISGFKNTLIPVKITARLMPRIENQRNKVMLFITNESWKMRLKREMDKLKAHSIEAELKVLRAQINPHFLFNTLNTIAHLVESGSDKAVKTIERMSELFRYTMMATKQSTIPISEELKYIDHFLEIEKLRYGSGLKVQFSVDNKAAENHIPPMLMQPLIENAVKYGEDREGNVNLQISVKKIKKYIIITISDNGCSNIDIKDMLSLSGTGIRNVNQRLKTLYRQKLEFEINTPEGLMVNIKIPAEARL